MSDIFLETLSLCLKEHQKKKHVEGGEDEKTKWRSIDLQEKTFENPETTLPGSFLVPTIKLKPKGQRIVIYTAKIRQELDSTTVPTKGDKE